MGTSRTILGVVFFLINLNIIYSQVGIGTTSPNSSTILEVVATDKGVLLPRVTLTGTTDTSTIGSPANSLLIYNTASVSDVTPGFYHWNSTLSRWVRLLDSQSDDWTVKGNGSTNPASDFIGTTDAVDFVIRTNNNEAMRVQSGGQVAIGTTSVSGDNFVEIRTSTADIDGLSSYVTGTGGIAIYGESPDYYGVWGVASASGTGVYGSSTGGVGVRGTTFADEAVSGLVRPGVMGVSNATGAKATGILGLAGSATKTVGVRAVGGGSVSYVDADVNHIGLTANAPQLAVYAYAHNTTGERYAGHFKAEFDSDDNTYNEPRAQLAGFNPDGVGLIGNQMYYGGYFYSGGTTTGGYAYVGSRENTGTVAVPVWTNHKIIGNGAVSTIVKGQADMVTMFAPEAPEVFFMDYGSGTLTNGEARIDLDPLFSKNIYTSKKKPLKVFVQVEGEHKGVFIVDKSSEGFTVKEANDGKSNASFSWFVVANRKDEVYKDGSTTSYQNLRFPIAPKRLNNSKTTKSKIGIEQSKKIAFE